MQFVYQPEGAAEKRWDFEPAKLMNAEAEAIERHTRMTFGEWEDAARRGSVLAIHGLLFVLLKREIPTLKWDEVQFSMSEVDWQLDDEESARALEALAEKESNGTLDPSEASLLEALRASAAEAPAPVEEPAPVDDDQPDHERHDGGESGEG